MSAATIPEEEVSGVDAWVDLLGNVFLLVLLGVLTTFIVKMVIRDVKRARSRRFVLEAYEGEFHDFSGTVYDPADEEMAHALRYAWLAYDPHEGVVFRSVSWQFYFRARETEARCILGFEHSVPGEHCTCGFYAMRDIHALRKQAFSYIRRSVHVISVLEVRLFGEIVQGEKGLRSANQIVEKVWLPYVCASDYCRNRASLMLLEAPADGTPVQRGLLHPRCAEHAKPSDVSFDIHQLRNLLATEVEWGHAPG